MIAAILFLVVSPLITLFIMLLEVLGGKSIEKVLSEYFGFE